MSASPAEANALLAYQMQRQAHEDFERHLRQRDASSYLAAIYGSRPIQQAEQYNPVLLLLPS